MTGGRWASSALLLLFCASGHGQSRWHFQGDLVSLDETLPTGAQYVEERGLRLRADYMRALPAIGPLMLEYRGGLYASFVNHQATDPTRVTIPSGSENLNQAGQYGTRQALRTTLGASPLRPLAQIELDAWYRPLDYYEIWIVPSLRLGAILSSPALSVELGVVRTIGPRVRTQTTVAPWHADRDTTLRLGESTQPFLSASFPLRSGAEVGVVFERYRFGASAATPLSSGIGIVQPETAIDSVGAFYRTRFR